MDYTEPITGVSLQSIQHTISPKARSMFEQITNNDNETDNQYATSLINIFGSHVYQKAAFGNYKHVTLFFKQRNNTPRWDIPASLLSNFGNFSHESDPFELVESYITRLGVIGAPYHKSTISGESDIKANLIGGELESIDTFFDKQDTLKHTKLKRAIACAKNLEHVKVFGHIMKKLVILNKQKKGKCKQAYGDSGG